VYRDEKGNVQHSATVEKVKPKEGGKNDVRVKDKPGLAEPRNNVPVKDAWPEAKTIEYYCKPPPPPMSPAEPDYGYSFSYA
jgi:hypothetical protein